MGDKIFENAGDFERHYFPESSLERLKNAIAGYYNLEKTSDCRFSEFARDKNTGIIEFSRPNYSTKEDIENIIRDFYKKEGFELSTEDVKKLPGTERINLSKLNKKYEILISENDNLYSIFVCKSY